MSIELDFAKRPMHVSHMRQTIHNVVDSSSLAIKRLDNFWTVGATTYKDKPIRSEQEFQDFIALRNGQMLEVFHDFYRFQLEYFRDLLKAPCEYRVDAPLPGFHCFKYCKEFEKPLARPHVDVPFNQYDWGKRNGYNEIFTHVVPVEVPPGAGMYVWNITAEDIHEKGYEVVKAQVETTEPVEFFEHRVNRMLFHSGRYVHQIKPFDPGQEGLWRITLQSHAIKQDGVWFLYW